MVVSGGCLSAAGLVPAAGGDGAVRAALVPPAAARRAHRRRALRTDALRVRRAHQPDRHTLEYIQVSHLHNYTSYYLSANSCARGFGCCCSYNINIQGAPRGLCGAARLARGAAAAGAAAAVLHAERGLGAARAAAAAPAPKALLSAHRDHLLQHQRQYCHHLHTHYQHTIPMYCQHNTTQVNAPSGYPR